MKFRHEWKHELNSNDMRILRMRLSAVMKKDEHSIDGKYFIRSLYFDDLRDTALRDKIDGVNCREKFRIRYYNNDTSFISLEKKSKINGLCSKESSNLSKEQAQSIVNGNIEWMKDSHDELIVELYSKMKSKGIKPKTIVDYTREAFIYKPGNVRVTLDYNIRTGLHCTDFLNPKAVTIPAGQAPVILEVKWDDFLPTIIKDIVLIPGRRSSAFSKYAQCRIYG